MKNHQDYLFLILFLKKEYNDLWNTKKTINNLLFTYKQIVVIAAIYINDNNINQKILFIQFLPSFFDDFTLKRIKNYFNGCIQFIYIGKGCYFKTKESFTNFFQSLFFLDNNILNIFEFISLI